MCHAKTDVSSKQINGKICLYPHPGLGPSEWTKAERPSGTKLSLPVSSLQPVWALMYADLVADAGASLRWTNNPSVYFRVHKSHILQKNVCTRYDFDWAVRWDFVWPSGVRGRTEQCHERKNEFGSSISVYLFVSWVIKPDDTMKQERGWRRAQIRTHSFFYLKRGTWPADCICMMNRNNGIYRLPYSTKIYRTTACTVPVSYPRHVIALLSVSLCLLLFCHKHRKPAILSWLPRRWIMDEMKSSCRYLADQVSC